MKVTDKVFLLTLTFIALKLSGQIAWSWLWVFAPIWIHAALAMTIGFVAGFRKAMGRREGKGDIKVADGR